MARWQKAARQCHFMNGGKWWFNLFNKLIVCLRIIPNVGESYSSMWAHGMRLKSD